MANGARSRTRETYTRTAVAAIVATMATSVGDVFPGPAGRRNGSVPIASAASASAAARHCGIRAVSNGDRGAPKYPPIAAPAVLNPSP